MVRGISLALALMMVAKPCAMAVAESSNQTLHRQQALSQRLLSTSFPSPSFSKLLRDYSKCVTSPTHRTIDVWPRSALAVGFLAATGALISGDYRLAYGLFALTVAAVGSFHLSGDNDDSLIRDGAFDRE